MGELSELVYLVDDEPLILKALGRLLKANGIETKAYLTARGFLEAYDPQRPGCLILDLELADMSGLELQRTLRERGSTYPIVFLSGHADVARSVSAMKNGAVDFLTKPVRKATLLAAVRNAIKRSRTDQASSRQHEYVLQLCSQLTRRECEVVDGIASGLLNKQIAANLGIVEKTVKVHRARAISKLGCRSSFELLRLVNSAPAILPLLRTFDGVHAEAVQQRAAPDGAPPGSRNHSTLNVADRSITRSGAGPAFQRDAAGSRTDNSALLPEPSDRLSLGRSYRQ